MPSENHLKNGGLESSSASVGSSNQSRSSVVCFSHQRRGILGRLLVHRQVGDQRVLDEVLGRLEAFLLEEILELSFERAFFGRHLWSSPLFGGEAT